MKCPWNCGFECKTVKQLHNHIINYPHSGIAMKLAEMVFKK